MNPMIYGAELMHGPLFGVPSENIPQGPPEWDATMQPQLIPQAPPSTPVNTSFSSRRNKY